MPENSQLASDWRPNWRNEEDYAFAQRLRGTLDQARQIDEITRTEETWQDWEAVYGPLTTGRGGLLGAMVARGAAHVTRLSALYAVLDGSALIRPEHQAAALAMWEYAAESAAWVFGERLGDATADTLLASLRDVGDEGLTRTQLSRLLANHARGEKMDRALAVIESAGLASPRKDRTAGRSAERWVATITDRCERSEESERRVRA